MDIGSKFILPGVIFLLTSGSGIWLSNSGKPLNTAVFTVHKLIALGCVVYSVIQLFQIFKIVDIQTLFIVLMIIAALSVLALFASGALMSIGKVDYNTLLTIHKIAPFLLAISMAVLVFLLTAKKI